MFSQSCSWCHELNELRGAPTYCWNCRHRADIGRHSCDCRACRQAVFEVMDRILGTTREI